MKRAALAALVLLVVAVAPADAAEVGTSFPDDFPQIIDHSLKKPVIGFGGSEGAVSRVPVIFLHGNNDSPYETQCNSFGDIHNMAQHFADNGYGSRELWGLGYQGDQCDLLTDQSKRSGEEHSTEANVPDLRAFVRAVLDYTGAPQVDIVGHSLGATLTREWLRQDGAYGLVRRVVSVDGPNHGIINCSPNPRNYWQRVGDFTPERPICAEYGSVRTPLLTALNGGDETPGPTEWMAIVNADTSFVFYDEQDGTIPPVPAEDRDGEPHDFSRSAWLEGARVVELTGQGRYDEALLTAHLGIIDSPETWKAAFEFLSAPSTPSTAASAPDASASGSGGASAAGPPAGSPADVRGASQERLAATGGSSPLFLALAVLFVSFVFRRKARAT